MLFSKKIGLKEFFFTSSRRIEKTKKVRQKIKQREINSNEDKTKNFRKKLSRMGQVGVLFVDFLNTLFNRIIVLCFILIKLVILVMDSTMYFFFIKPNTTSNRRNIIY